MFRLLRVLFVVVAATSFSAFLPNEKVVAQDFGFQAGPKFMTGASVARFRVSYDDFQRFYGTRSGSAWGGFASYLLKTPYNISVKYRKFDKSRRADTPLGQDQNLVWEESWINVGVRYITPSRRGLTNYFSFGFTFNTINETGDVSLFGDNSTPRESSAGGFYLDFGMHYPFMRYFTLYGEIELSSAGIEGKSGFEGSSVGGYWFGAGIAVMPF